MVAVSVCCAVPFWGSSCPTNTWLPPQFLRVQLSHQHVAPTSTFGGPVVPPTRGPHLNFWGSSCPTNTWPHLNFWGPVVPPTRGSHLNFWGPVVPPTRGPHLNFWGPVVPPTRGSHLNFWGSSCPTNTWPPPQLLSQQVQAPHYSSQHTKQIFAVAM
ncbi:hypothetical protein Pmani_011475 [Petrolisthes manimaculis]|uniref:Uncharacterized protein n=1 Tax=Petrolisthes manimaculis TaxID=1843537 RepID=A0AAE1PZ81_9EUCA|nr:hypothetical protein Pmani_011475 [Petrolisthes manimaculis]